MEFVTENSRCLAVMDSSGIGDAQAEAIAALVDTSHLTDVCSFCVDDPSLTFS
jgi:hypothetical protein